MSVKRQFIVHERKETIVRYMSVKR
jgi:hypothetical protein